MISRYIILFIAALLFIKVNTATCEEDPPGEGPEEVILTFNYSGLKKNLINCYYYKEQVFVPVKQLFDLFQINNSYNLPEEKIKGFFIDKDKEYEINFASRTIVNNEEEINISESEFIIVEGHYYVLPIVLKRAFGMDFKIRLSNLSMSLTTDKVLPFFMNFKRNSLRKGLLRDNGEESPLLFERKRSLFNGGFLDYIVTANHKKRTEPSYSYDLSTGNEILGGDLNVNVNGQVSKYSDNVTTDANWRYVVGNNPIVNQFILGTHLTSQGILPAQYKGGTITNAPYGVRNNFSKYVLVDKTIPESDVELYINSELKDFTKANEFGDFTFDIPLNYGTTIIELKIYSPQGELIESSRKIQVPFDLLPVKELQYTVSGGLNDVTNKKVINGSVAFGITSWLTNKAGADHVEGQYDKPILYNSLSGRISDNYLFNLTAAPKLYYQFNFNASYYTLQAFNLRYTRYEEDALFNSQRIRDDYQFAASLPYKIFDKKQGLQIIGRYTDGDLFKRSRIEATSSFSVLNLNPSINFLYDDNNGIDQRVIHKELAAGINIPLFGLDQMEFFHGKSVKAKVTYDMIQKNVSLLNLSYAHSITRDLRFQLNYIRDFPGSLTYFNVQLQYDLPFAITSVTAYRDELNSTIQGSVGFDAANGTIFYSKRRSTGTSGVAFRMFDDLNSNGAFDEGEDVIDDVNLKFDRNVKVKRNDDGLLVANEMNPYSEYYLNMNKLSGKNPYLVPKHIKFGLETDPNCVKLVEIPFYHSEELNGYVIAEKDGKTVPIPGVKIKLKNKETNKVTEIESYSDGSIYYLGLLPGKYTAYLDTTQMNQMGTIAIPSMLDFEIKGKDGEGSVADLNFILNGKNNLAENTDTAATNVKGAAYTVQLGAFQYIQNVMKFSNVIKTELQIEVEIKELTDGLFRLLSGTFKTPEDAREYANYLKSRGYDAFLRVEEE